MHERLQTKQEELQYLAKEYQKNPDLFSQRTFIEDAATLAEFGIHIPGKEDFIPACLKFWPEDFIVEEVRLDGVAESVSGERGDMVGEPGPTIYATLVKCGLSTIEVVDDLSRALGIKKEQISYAGIKDKAAITAQQISLRGTTIDAVRQVASPFFFLKDISYGKGVVEKGKLKGNRFTILMRTAQSLKEGEASRITAQALERVHAHGFYNFFYLQRFGTPRLRNFQWAYDILRGNYESAVFDFLTFGSERELEYFKGLRRDIEASFGNWEAVEDILAPFPIIFSHERKVVAHLRAHPGDWAGALQTIPEQITLWVYALTSVFFNKKISECLLQGRELPAELPFFLSPERDDQNIYRSMLETYGLYPLPLKNLRPFPAVQMRRHLVPTRDRANIVRGDVVDEGLLLQFDLAKGQYATTFLSHIFDLASGQPLGGIMKNRVDTKERVGEAPLAPVVERFSSVIQERTDNFFETLLAKGE